jgi:hypothetical protein
MTLAICIGCHFLLPCTNDVCNMCAADGVVRVARPPKPDPVHTGSVPDSKPLVERERARVDAIRAENPAGWAAALPGPVEPLNVVLRGART